jgi:RND family efflux transporter MFP subunit
MSTVEARRSPVRIALISALAAGVGLFGLIGFRVKQSLAERAALAATLETGAQKGPARAGAATVHGEPVTYRPVIPVTGTLAPVQDADVGFKMGGRLQVVKVKVGDRVKAGHLLASLDVAEASAQAAAAAAAVRAAEVAAEMARDGGRRTEALFATNSVSEAERTATLNRTALAEAQLAQARAQASLASTGVSNGRLSAPFGGLVTRTPNGIGKIVGPGEPLFHLEDTTVLKLSATLSEADARAVAIGDEVSIDDVAAEGRKGKITAVLGSLDPQTRRVPIVAEIPNEGASTLLAGAFVRASVISGREISALKLPATALRPGSQDEIVLVEQGRARVVHVLFSTGADGAILVRSGLHEKDAVLKSPSSEVREGEEIALEGAPAAKH